MVALAASCLPSAPSLGLEDLECPVDEVCRSTDSGIPLRILTKPGAAVFSEPDSESVILSSDIPAFQTFFVRELIDVEFDRETMESFGWYNVAVGRNDDPFGFIPADLAVPWRQALAVAYTNPGTSERKPVLMFEDRDALEGVMASIMDGSLEGIVLHDEIAEGAPREGLVSREPSVWVDINDSFYLLPIVEHEDFSFYSSPEDMRALRVSAVTNEVESSRAKACDVAAADFEECQLASSSPRVIESLAMDIVFVVDMTGSMAPYIEAVRGSISAVSRKLLERSSGGSIRFGIVGYRDNEPDNQNVGFVVRDFTPELLPAGDFREVLNHPEIRAEGGGDIPEEVFAGVRAAINAAWSPEGEAARLLVLIGDASAHGNLSPTSVTGLDERGLRDLTDENDIYTAAVFLGTDPADRELARPQFETLAAGSGEDKAVSFVASQGESLEASLRDVLLRLIEFVASGDFRAILSEGTGNTGEPTGSGDVETTEALLGAMRAAFVDYLGTGASPPPSITAWVLDRDIVDYSDRSFDVKVLVTKEDLQNLISFYRNLISQLEGGTATTSDFFGSATAGSVLTSYDLGLEENQALQESGAMPRIIASLPYKSKLLTMTLDEFKNMPGDLRNSIETELKSKVEYFEEALNNTDAWVLMNVEATDDDRMFLMDLRWMP